ncbi:hypothetical protein HPB51_026185 [Rhipicephalus microplus]|uniref:Uncharacterized protein n=1 Tax=Rhipicephalus microplus TaxID=6941 RepID=A0A9J6DY72_RHIMP|nr:hypothetical protein HPB51_026185 [Rhipicephalus microplus]
MCHSASSERRVRRASRVYPSSFLSKERRCALSAARTSVAHPGVHELVSRTGARAAEEAPRVLGSVEHAVPLGVTEVAGPFRLEAPLRRGLRPRSLSGGTRIRGSVCLTPHLPGRYAEPPSGFIFQLDFDPQRKGRSAHRAAPFATGIRSLLFTSLLPRKQRASRTRKADAAATRGITAAGRRVY